MPARAAGPSALYRKALQVAGALAGVAALQPVAFSTWPVDKLGPALKSTSCQLYDASANRVKPSATSKLSRPKRLRRSSSGSRPMRRPESLTRHEPPCVKVG